MAVDDITQTGLRRPDYEQADSGEPCVSPQSPVAYRAANALGLELEIRAAERAMQLADTLDKRRQEWERLRALLLKRTPERVAEMETRKGLR